MSGDARRATLFPLRDTKKGLAASVERHLRDYFAAHGTVLPAAGLYDRILQEIERPLLSIALSECRGNQLRAAELLGLNRNTLRKKLRDLGLTTSRTGKPAKPTLYAVGDHED